MAAEPRAMSIQERIASFNQAHWVGRDRNGNRPTPGAAPAPAFRPAPPAPPVPRPSIAARNDPINSRSEPAQNSAPLPRRLSAIDVDNAGKPTAPPPPMSTLRPPGRNPSIQPRPPSSRRPPPPPSRKNSSESVASEASLSTTTSASAGRRTPATSSSSPDSTVHRVLAPAWGEAELPPLPPRREQTNGTRGSYKLSPPSEQKRAQPGIPPKAPSSTGEGRRLSSRPPSRVSVDESPRPSLPSRLSLSADSRENGASAPRLPSRPPSRAPSTNGSEYSQSPADDNAKPRLGKLPPPPVPTSKLRPTGLGGWMKSSGSQEKPNIAADAAHRSLANGSAGASEEKRTPSKAPPPLPSRTPSEYNASQSSASTSDNSNKPQPRKLPPVVPADNLRSMGFAALRKNTESPIRPNTATDVPQTQNRAPPPVPLASRPDLSKIQATKPRPYSGQSSTTGSNMTCLKCRDFSSPDAHAARFPRESLPTYDIAWLSHQLTAPFPSPTDKARVIFTWLHHNVAYDVHSFFNSCVKPSTPVDTIASGLAVCAGYAGLFAALATSAGLEAKEVSGHGKGFGFQDLAPGSSLPPYQGNHAWNAVRIDNGQWKLVDSCWGAGVIQGPGQPYKKLFNPSMFTDTNDEFGRRHFPSDQSMSYRDDGRPGITWEEYLQPESHPFTYIGAGDNGISEHTFQPATSRISVHQPGPLRIQFGVVCPHWSYEYHGKQKPPFFLLETQDDRIPFNHFQPSGPRGGGDMWYLDIADPRVLGAPGQSISVVALVSFGDRQDARGLSQQEYRAGVGRVGMSWTGVANWGLV